MMELFTKSESVRSKKERMTEKRGWGSSSIAQKGIKGKFGRGAKNQGGTLIGCVVT